MKKTTESESIIKIVSKDKKPLTKNQSLFNKLTKKIEELEREIIEEDANLNKLLTLFSKKARPLIEENANLRIKTSMFLAETTSKVKYTKKQSENVSDVIVYLCNDAFRFIVPNEEQEKFYDSWSKTTYQDELKEQSNETKEDLSDFMKNTFGLDIDLKDLGDDPEDFMKFQEKLKEQFEKPKKKTKKQIQKEAEIEAEEEIKNKSIRSIYITLAKILHPDSEIDKKLKEEKEELMKKVTSAYDNKDLPTLLKLEMEWVYNQTQNLDKLSDSKLKIYISALKEQVAELEMEKHSIRLNPRFSDIQDIYDESEIKVLVREQNKNLKLFENILKSFEESYDKKEILKFVNDYIEEIEESEEVDLFEDFLNFGFE